MNHGLKSRENLTGFLFVLPSLAGFLIFILIPILISLGISLTSWDIVSGFKNIRWVGTSNYLQLFNDRYFIKSLTNNLLYTFTYVPGTMIVGLLLALAMNRGIFGKNALKAMFFMPFIVNVVAVSIIWMALFHPLSGPINKTLQAFGVANPPMWLSDRKTAMLSIVIVNIWVYAGYVMVIYLGALQNVPRELYEAADMDGASALRKFFQITMPMISPTTFFIMITTIINSFKVFGTVNVMTQGGPAGDATTVIVFDIYQTAFRYYKMGYASAMSWVLFAMIFVVTIIQWQGQKKWVGYSI